MIKNKEKYESRYLRLRKETITQLSKEATKDHRTLISLLQKIVEDYAENHKNVAK